MAAKDRHSLFAALNFITSLGCYYIITVNSFLFLFLNDGDCFGRKDGWRKAR